MSQLEEHHDALGLLAIGDALESHEALHALVETCPSPLHRWFHDQRQRIVSLAVDAMARGEIERDHGAAMDYLSRIRWQDALDTLKGKPLVLTAATEHGETALAGARGAGLISDAMSARGSVNSITYGSPVRVVRMLKHVSERRHILAEMERQASVLSRVATTDDAGPILATLSELLRSSTGSVNERSLGDALGQAIAKAEQEAQRRAAGTYRPISWGVPSLDKDLPIRTGRVYVLSARPGGGKTSLGIQAAHATSQALGRRSVAYLSMEMGAEELALVLACRDAHVPRRKAEEAWEDLLEDDRRDLRALSKQWSDEGSLWIRDSAAGAQTASSVASWIRSQKARHGALALVVVDYLNLIRGSSPRLQLTDRTAEITSTLKQVALAEDVAILLLAQITREGRKPGRSADGALQADPIPRMEDLYGGGAVEADADAIVFLHPLQREGETRRVDAIVAKNRRGPFGLTLPLWLYGAHQHFQDAVSTEEAASRAARVASAPSDEENVF